MVHAELVLLAYALKDPLNQRFVLLSETDVPLWPLEATYATLFSAEVSFLETKLSENRYYLYDFKDSGPTRAEWRQGSQWFALTRKHAEAVADQRMIRKWRAGCVLEGRGPLDARRAEAEKHRRTEVLAK